MAARRGPLEMGAMGGKMPMGGSDAGRVVFARLQGWERLEGTQGTLGDVSSMFATLGLRGKQPGHSLGVTISFGGGVMGKQARVALILAGTACLLACMVDWVVEELH